MYVKYILLIFWTNLNVGQLERCDQTPPNAKVGPSENNNLFSLTIETEKHELEYLPDQTYVVTLKSLNSTRPFRWFVITAEDPNVDTTPYEIAPKTTDVGSLKILDTGIGSKSRYSEKCSVSVENTDNSNKYKIEIHWISPQPSDANQEVRLRATVAENDEVWYSGEGDGNLTVLIKKDSMRAEDSPPEDPNPTCNLCSEARYEVIFEGKWSRLTHPYHYPSKPDENGYSHMVGASHDFDYILWKTGHQASPGMQKLAEDGDISLLERSIIEAMNEKYGTRTLIRGKRRHHPYMSEPSHAIFRVDRFHHLFSLAVAMRPSPDWFLGTSQFELCTLHGWLEKGQIPLYPWDVGTMDGVSYESKKSKSQIQEVIKRVEVGSFNKDSPFYQTNLKELRPFAILKVRRLDIYPLVGEDCSDVQEGQDENEQEREDGDDDEEEEESQDEPQLGESTQNHCRMSQWSEWSACQSADGVCGRGQQTRTRRRMDDYVSRNQEDWSYVSPVDCEADRTVENQYCFVNCFLLN
ncbi:spondin-2-like [Plodia interpunctella]|uniref:spondin-2-like n=1 Tax=Plodia interpunctella TaxID=58824 RepID=UPI002367BD9E|nr:spondin-2-like [Plodia interpunctella]